MNILDLFKPNIPTKTNKGYKTICPDCGLQGGRTEGFILYPENNTWSCHGSGKHGGILELIAIQNHIIKCIDCNDTGEKGSILKGELFTETLDTIKNEYGDEFYNALLNQINLKLLIELPNQGILISEFAETIANRVKNNDIFFCRSASDTIIEIGKIRHPNGDKEYIGFKTLQADRFVTLIERYFKPWGKIYTKKGSMHVTKSMSQNISKLVLVSDNFKNKMPIIDRLFNVPIPIIYNKKLTFPVNGYDKRFGSWLPFNAPQINPDMKFKDGKKIIDHIFSEFCFKNDLDRTKAIAACITPFLRGLFSAFNVRTPVSFYLANRPRVGKDYCAGVTGIIYEGTDLEESPICSGERGNNNEELRKKIMTSLMAGRKRLHFANNKGYINNAIFEKIVTSKRHSDRILGRNEEQAYDNEFDFSMSGNTGITYTSDFANRCIFINLFYAEEDANARKFVNPNLHEWIKNNRSEILSAFYCLVKNWIDKKKKPGSLLFTSFPEWASICGGIMESAGYANPCKKDKDSLDISGDPEVEDMKKLYELCYEKYNNIWINREDIFKIIEDEDIFGYIDLDKRSDQIKFGKKMSKFVGRILSNIQLIDSGEHIRSSRKQYKFVIQKENDVGNVGNIGNVQLTKESAKREGEYIVERTMPTMPTMPKKKIKSDREIQFWEAQECKNIITKSTKKDILKYIKQHPNQSYKKIHKVFGIGFYKWIKELREEDKIK